MNRGGPFSPGMAVALGREPILPPLGAEGLARERIFALILLTVAAYRAPSPLADMLLGSTPYGFLAVVVALLGYTWRYGRISAGAHGIAMPATLTLTFAILGAALIVHALVHPSSALPDAKYLALLTLVWAMIAYMPTDWYRAWLQGQTMFFIGYLAVILLIVAGLYLGWLDLEDWRANTAVLLPSDNILRQMADAGNETYLVLYSLTVPKLDSRYALLGVEFTRFTGIFLEPTDAAMVILPLFFYSMDRARNADRRMLVAALCTGIAILAAFAYSGFVALLVGLGLIVLTRNTARTRVMAAVRVGAIAVGVALVVALIVAPEDVIGAISEAKRTEFISRKALFMESIDTYANPGLLGQGVYPTEEQYVPSYGLLAVWLQYGPVGSIALACFLIPFVRAAWGLLSSSRFWIGGLAFSSLVMFLKTSEIVNLFFLAIYAYVLHEWMRLSPRLRADGACGLDTDVSHVALPASTAT